jgi:hypothetical protein
MTAEQAAEWGKSITFEQVWATLQEVGRKHSETEEIVREVGRKQAKNEELLAQLGKTIEQVGDDIRGVNRSSAERLARLEKNIGQVNRSADERLAKLEKTVERVSNNVGGLNRSMGELIETLIAARLWEKFPKYGLSRSYQRVPIYGEKNDVKTDIDILLVNTTLCMAVEVKHELDRMDDVSRHLKRMRLIRQYPPEQVNGKQLLGAMAGGVVDPEVKNYAYESGFFVLELTGESIRLVTPPEGFVPQEW